MARYSGTRYQVFNFSTRLLALLTLATDLRKVLRSRSMSLGVIFEGKNLIKLEQVKDLNEIHHYTLG